MDIYSARETGVMQGPEKHNLTRITDALLHFSSNFKEISYELSLLSARWVGKFAIPSRNRVRGRFSSLVPCRNMSI